MKLKPVDLDPFDFNLSWIAQGARDMKAGLFGADSFQEPPPGEVSPVARELFQRLKNSFNGQLPVFTPPQPTRKACPNCRGYNLESSWCETCDRKGYIEE